MDYSEKWGKDVDEAVRLALQDLNAAESDVNITVLEEPTKGFLGLGAKLAKVRVERKSESEKKEEKIEKAKEKEKAESSQDDSKFEKNKVRDYRKKKPGKPQERSGGYEKDRSRDRQSGIKDGSIGFVPDDDKATERVSISERPKDLVPAADDNIAAAFIRDVVGKMGLDVNIQSFENKECTYIEMDGKDSRTIIGKRGQTLDAIQYLTNLVMNKEREEYIRVIVDVEGYRLRREKTLEQLASKLAKKVERTGRNVRLEPMNPYERKVIHATLQSNGRVTTRSEGEEPYRRVIIEKK